MIIKAEITKRVNGDKPLKAFADVIINGAVVIHGIGVVEKEAGRYITMPRSQWKNKEGEIRQRDICHPISTAARSMIEEAVFVAYDSKDET